MSQEEARSIQNNPSDAEMVQRNLLFRRMVVISLMILGYACLGLYSRVVLRSSALYTHVAYIPIVLSCMWWGRKGIAVALFLTFMAIIFNLMGYGTTEELARDSARTMFFIAVAFVVGTLRDQVRTGQDALRLSEERYRALIGSSRSGFIVCRDEIILFINPRMCEMLGMNVEQVVGKSIQDLLHRGDRRDVSEFLSLTKTSGAAGLHGEYRFIGSEGRPVWVDMSSALTEFDGGPAILLNAYDISDRKRAEQKQRQLLDVARKQEAQLIHSTRLAELGEMAASIAHELNQPLTGIRNFAKNTSYMLDHDIGSRDDVRNNLRLISEQVDRASRIINQMRQLTRRGEREFVEIGLNSVIRDTVEFLMPQMRLSGVEVVLELDEKLPNVMGDRLRMEQVFLNLLTNARQAMEGSLKRHLYVRSYVDPGSDCPIVAEVEDTGKGFDPRDTQRLFTPFYSTKASGQGTGLGLSISYRIIRDHNGRIDAKGAPGQGAKFIVALPSLESEDSRKAADEDVQTD
ncbi:MAG TPA: PAS domain S-box protein [Candidatus Brocadiia bacterium]|nr:PAS domain S-box protein [Candidatus Brocadiia bacterium]